MKDEIDVLKQSVADIGQATMNYCERYENMLSCNSFLLLIILVLLAFMMIQMPTKLGTNVNEATEVRSHNDHKTSEVSQANNFETFWLSKYDSVNEQNHNQVLPVILKLTDFA